MKILVIIQAVGKIYGGTSKIVVELAQALGSQGISVDVVTTNANGRRKLDVQLNTWITEDNYRIQYFSPINLSGSIFSWSLAKWLFNHVSDYDLVNTNGIFSICNLPAYWACRWHRVPHIITPHGMLEPWALSYKAWKKRFFYPLFEKPALNHANVIQMSASTEAENCKSLNLKTPFVVVPNGIHRQDFETLPDPEVFYQKFPNTRGRILIIFLGRLDPKKGLDLLAKAFAKVYAQFPQSHLVIAGPDNIGFEPKVRDYFANAGCLDAVTFTGMLTGTLKHAALAASSIYVSPSYSEGFSMSILEGMASGLPCIITTGCNFPEASANHAACVVNIDANEIGKALIQCLDNPQQAKVMGERARKLVFEKYTWEGIASQMQQVYKEIINTTSAKSLAKGKDSFA